MLFPTDRRSLRRMYVEAWQRSRQSLPLEPLQARIADVVTVHPEYHAALEAGGETLEKDWHGEDGQSNPFLHMGMHLAIREQAATDRPAGIAAIHRALSERLGDPHAAEHLMMECLAAELWRAQQNGIAPDESDYLEALRRL
jgi:hypothetical protein